MEINLGERLKKIRIQNGITQEELSLQLYLTRQTISKWETGKSLPDIENLILLCQFYNISLDDLVGLSSLSYSKENIQKNNKRREFFNLLTRNSKVFLGSVATIIILLYSYSLIQQHNINTSTEYADSFLVYRVKDIEYENNKPKGKIKSITLTNNKKIEPVTYEKIEEFELRNKIKYGNAMVDSEFNDGFRISKNSLK